jgi:hypothetical protein
VAIRIRQAGAPASQPEPSEPDVITTEALEAEFLESEVL